MKKLFFCMLLLLLSGLFLGIVVYCFVLLLKTTTPEAETVIVPVSAAAAESPTPSPTPTPKPSPRPSDIPAVTATPPPAEVAADTLEEPASTGQNVEAAAPIVWPGGYYLKVNVQANTVTVYMCDDNDAYTVPVRAMVCSTGSATPGSGLYALGWRQT